MVEQSKQSLSYRDAGVDIDAGNEAVLSIKPMVQATYRPEVMGDLGGFGGLFALDTSRYCQPVLVSGTDGVGTKLQVAFMMDKHDTIGQDVVAMCVNDILAQGAEPLFFLDYLAVGKLLPEQVAQIVKGVASACKASGCSLIGGETAEMAGFYRHGEYDIAGFCVGVAEKDQLLPKQTIGAGDKIIGLPSSGLHSNGFSLVRKICFDHAGLAIDAWVTELNTTLGDALLTPTRLYPKQVLPLLNQADIKGVVHITGGGFYDNIPRVLPDNCGVRIYAESWPMPAIFPFLQQLGNVAPHEMYRTFNMGIGLMLVVPESQVEEVIALLAAQGEAAYLIGEVVAGEHDVVIEGID